jgi:hypothetical protein
MRRLLIAVLLVAGCSQDEPVATPAAKPTAQPPSHAAAREVIANAPELGDFEFTSAGWSVITKGSAMGDAARATAKELAAEKWLAFDGAGDIVLTEKSKADKRFLLRPNGVLDIVPLAKKEMGGVGAVRPLPDGTAEADFTWRWIPNEVGTAFKTGPVHDRFAGEQHATATLMHDGSTWVLLKIERRIRPKS